MRRCTLTIRAAEPKRSGSTRLQALSVAETKPQIDTIVALSYAFELDVESRICNGLFSPMDA